jgi:pyrimidine-nucleoside phosphorylase
MSVNIPEIVRKKRDGQTLDPEEIKNLIDRYTLGQVPDYQMSAMLMAVFFRGLDASELDAWTGAMVHSGTVLDLTGLPGAKVDKHSTGGVGDKISLCLAPAVAACGVTVPMIAGRGLGHTGGTLDKLEAIPGFRVDLSIERARDQLSKLGLFIMGQTEDLAPADRKLYALRDVTGTVESIPLIASSIMSKKIAEGIDALVLDVKVGAGAFMTDLDRARELAETLVGIGAGAGIRMRALLTDMGKPLGRAVGCALEAAEAIDVMKGNGPGDTVELTVALGAEMLVLGGVAAGPAEAREAMVEALSGGRALELFGKMVQAQGGDPRVCDDPKKLPTASNTIVVKALRGGFISSIHPRKVAMAALEVGAGRKVMADVIDPSTGVILLVDVGDEVEAGRPLAELHLNRTTADHAAGLLEGAFEIDSAPKAGQQLIVERI